MSLRILNDLVQGTEEWLAARRGMVTASTVGQLISIDTLGAEHFACPTCHGEPGGPCLSLAKGKTGPIQSVHKERIAAAAAAGVIDLRPARNDTARRIILTLAAERITGWTEDTPMTNDMWRGVEGEPFARAVYAKHYAPVAEVGFMVRTIDGLELGYSPDGLVGDAGLIEVKCPRAKTHVQTILADEVPAYYMAQCQTGLLVSGCKWIDFVSYVSGMPLYVKRVEPDPKWQAAITEAHKAAEQAIAQAVTDYESRVAGLHATERIDFNVVELRGVS